MKKADQRSGFSNKQLVSVARFGFWTGLLGKFLLVPCFVVEPYSGEGRADKPEQDQRQRHSNRLALVQLILENSDSGRNF